jgi:hypothetical protein
MLVESLIKETVELQGFRVAQVQKTGFGLEAELVPDRRYAPRCSTCGKPARYRDTRTTRRFRQGSNRRGNSGHQEQ